MVLSNVTYRRQTASAALNQSCRVSDLCHLTAGDGIQIIRIRLRANDRRFSDLFRNNHEPLVRNKREICNYTMLLNLLFRTEDKR